uniref:Uncharacterized protein n=1 Tax=Candidatus Kentrum sp. TC TaxID=2126339 RepID=A0A450Z2S9_9GAMM|nr:MAG: hypothetical protein BECKTC1821E_GA0114239_10598 [Candidatus Kentron sp. TC]VFK48067.1 MAG: hypothetical protein BECKTC1821D_GA0114238_10578 [Candidatus Kentron sp. TC]VFK61312.1 MAG: hypothetical protein BECKTC1821F_GA0114240_10578 [Candidatus Kentron sp. TC]
MACPLQYPICPPPSARPNPLITRSLINTDHPNKKLINIYTLIMIRICNRSIQNFLDNSSSLLLAKRKQIYSPLYPQTSNLISNQSSFLR